MENNKEQSNTFKQTTAKIPMHKKKKKKNTAMIIIFSLVHDIFGFNMQILRI